MKITRLRPIITTEKWHMDYYLYLYGFIKKEVFDEIMTAFKDRSDNAKYDELRKAILDGEIRYVDGIFLGKTGGAKIAKQMKEIGAKFKYRKWMIEPSLLPPDIKSAIMQSKLFMRGLREKLQKKFDKIQKNVSSFIQIADVDRFANQTMSKTSKAFQKTVRKELAVRPELDKLGMEKIKRDYLTTTELPIRKKLAHEFKDRTKVVLENFSQSTVEKLRKDLEKMIMDGASRKDVQNHIMGKLKISQQRCRFIARQETALLTTKFKKSQYEQWGIDKYEWRCIHDHKVRPRHLELDGDIFEWNNPPRVTEKGEPIRYGHPGEDFRCRCVATPVIEW